ncbi:putative ARF GTPase activator [Gregarina niphandrodes]|uniref:ARF GTPase activator n=1 Tax=Gregarina niphandrodes TaxID=110365 RepID=A0A023AY35_GRENI|nr:putative ARF GTPase activator [Gregarina niphandrodes]EZG43562.1 putative ARF GTPase activator [Gregarina niphandrodes]|eukprot:XP_011133206.1 putative ARF GTPase activator [Gregarina niphandrodes]
MTATPATLTKLPGNNLCADCHAPNPRWASINLGILICIECSGIHRALGTHISQVRSIALDQWTVSQVETCQRIGNQQANSFWEAQLPATFKRPSNQNRRDMEQFIKAKYVDRKWTPERAGPADSRTTTGVSGSAVTLSGHQPNAARQNSPVHQCATHSAHQSSSLWAGASSAGSRGPSRSSPSGQTEDLFTATQNPFQNPCSVHRPNWSARQGMAEQLAEVLDSQPAAAAGVTGSYDAAMGIAAGKSAAAGKDNGAMMEDLWAAGSSNPPPAVGASLDVVQTGLDYIQKGVSQPPPNLDILTQALNERI